MDPDGPGRDGVADPVNNDGLLLHVNGFYCAAAFDDVCLAGASPRSDRTGGLNCERQLRHSKKQCG